MMRNAHSRLGPAAPERGWVPAPRYLLRRDRIMRALRHHPPCKVLEIGCGPGILLQELTDFGFECTGLETSAAARSLAAQLAEHSGTATRFHSQPQSEWINSFPILMAFEVLEHIEDDAGALKQWRSWLNPNGTILLSVPAHQKRWNARDIWAGHVRRYERNQLRRLFESNGFVVDKIECYGFPLANVLELASARRYKQHNCAASPIDSSQRDANTAQSGIDRSSDMKWYPLLRSIPGQLALATATTAQRPFLSTEAGNGYLVIARKA